MVQILDQKRDLSGMMTMRQSPPVLGILREFWRHFGDGCRPIRPVTVDYRLVEAQERAEEAGTYIVSRATDRAAFCAVLPTTRRLSRFLESHPLVVERFEKISSTSFIACPTGGAAESNAAIGTMDRNRTASTCVCRGLSAATNDDQSVHAGHDRSRSESRERPWRSRC